MRKTKARELVQFGSNVRLGDAIGDLPPLEAGVGEHSVTYDLKRRTEQFLNGVATCPG